MIICNDLYILLRVLFDVLTLVSMIRTRLRVAFYVQSSMDLILFYWIKINFTHLEGFGFLDQTLWKLQRGTFLRSFLTPGRAKIKLRPKLINTKKLNSITPQVPTKKNLMPRLGQIFVWNIQ